MPARSDQSSVNESVFHVPKMDCSSEEQLIRVALASLHPNVAFDFDIPNRRVTVLHREEVNEVLDKLTPLKLEARLDHNKQVPESKLRMALSDRDKKNAKEAQTLVWLLAINAFMFCTEMVVGLIGQSTGLIADSLDMFADAAVYTVALLAVGKSVRNKVRAAHISGLVQMLLGLGALGEVIRRLVYGSEPVSSLMIAFGFIALIANSFCLFLISKEKKSGIHMKASWIFSSNDVVANTGVILAGALVALTGSTYPDLVIGFIISLVVLNGAIRILKL